MRYRSGVLFLIAAMAANLANASGAFGHSDFISRLLRDIYKTPVKTRIPRLCGSFKTAEATVVYDAEESGMLSRLAYNYFTRELEISSVPESQVTFEDEKHSQATAEGRRFLLHPELCEIFDYEISTQRQVFDRAQIKCGSISVNSETCKFFVSCDEADSAVCNFRAERKGSADGKWEFQVDTKNRRILEMPSECEYETSGGV